MPLYDYRCRACSKLTEVRHGFGEVHADACPECGGELARVFSPAGIVFKGSGFYLTDSRKASEKAKSAETAASTTTKPAADSAKTDVATAPAAPATAAPAAAPAASATPSAPAKSESSAA